MTQPKILIVDDDPANIAVLADILQADYEPLAARSGAAALDRIDRGVRPELILLDVKMPEMDGYAVCRRLQENPATADIPVIFITALTDTENEEQGLAAGAVDYITRPFSPAIIRARVDTHLALARTRKSSENRYQTLFDSIADGIFIYDEKGYLIEANPAFCRNTGYGRADMAGLTLGHILKIDDDRPAAQNRPALMPPDTEMVETRLVRQDGSVYPAEVSARRIEFGGKPAFLAVCRDITRRKADEEKIRAYQARLEELLARRTEELEEKGRTLAHLERDLKQRRRFANIIGKSEPMQALYARLEELAEVGASVLITGESGTGKELVAEALHYGGSRHDQPFIRVACSDLSENLIESELFGHVRGAFTGALKDRAGRFEKAAQGTVFLDEIGDIPSRFQMRLLRVLDERTFERVGASRPLPMNARVVAATHQDLPALIRQGAFREDLYYRLKVVEIHVPPLRERRQDIPLLCDHFLGLFAESFHKTIQGIAPAALQRLSAHNWPGNVRELRHVLENACIRCRSDRITEADLPPFSAAANPASSTRGDAGPTDEPERIREALTKAGDNKAKAARLMGISRRTLYRKLKKFDISDPPENKL